MSQKPRNFGGIVRVLVFYLNAGLKIFIVFLSSNSIQFYEYRVRECFLKKKRWLM